MNNEQKKQKIHTCAPGITETEKPPQRNVYRQSKAVRETKSSRFYEWYKTRWRDAFSRFRDFPGRTSIGIYYRPGFVGGAAQGDRRERRKLGFRDIRSTTAVLLLKNRYRQTRNNDVHKATNDVYIVVWTALPARITISEEETSFSCTTPTDFGGTSCTLFPPFDSSRR